MRAWSFAILLLALSAPAAMAADCHGLSPEDIARDESIAERLPALSSVPAARAPAPAGISQTDIDWALALEDGVRKGGIPSTAETARYEDIARRLMALQGTSQATSAVSQAEIDWALALEDRVRKGGAPSAQETARYQDIARRLQARRQTRETGQEEIEPALALEARARQPVCPGE